MNPREPEFHDLYFTNVTPNFKYFDLYNNYSNSNGINTIYILSPKNKKYLENLNVDLWSKIQHGMINRG